MMGNSRDVNHIFFTNLLLLGFDPAAMERKYRIPFNKDMFLLPNKKGFETVMYFLFNRLNPTKCKEMFRDCWPVFDKKQEQLFRGICCNWLSEIAQEDSEATLPRIVTSVFMSPGGRKFIEQLFYFSTYVLLKVAQKENGLKRKDYLQRPVLTAQTKSSGLSDVMASIIECSAIRLHNKFLTHIKQICAAQDRWKAHAIEEVKLYRSLTKTQKDKEVHLRASLNKTNEQTAQKTSSPSVTWRKSDGLQYNYDIQGVKRAQKVQKVRDLWHALEDHLQSAENDQKIVDSILEGSLDKLKLDASELSVRIPDRLLRHCEQEIHRRGIENICLGEKLNLLSLIHLSNLSLHLHIDKLNNAGVPDFNEALPRMTSEVRSHHSKLNEQQAQRLKFQKDILPELKESIQTIGAKLRRELFKDKSPDSIRVTSLGLEMLSETPLLNFEPADSDSPQTNNFLNLSPDQVPTPEAVEKLISNVRDSVKQRSSEDTQSTPLTWCTSQKKRTQSKLPAHGVIGQRVGLRQRTYPKSKSKNTEIFKVPAVNPQKKQAVNHPQTTSAPASHKSEATVTIMDELADKIAESFLYHSAEDDNDDDNSQQQEIDTSCIDSESFASKDELHHSCSTAGHKPWHHLHLHDSIGPLSSTHVEQGSRNHVDKLFMSEPSDNQNNMKDVTTQSPRELHYQNADLDRIRAASPLGHNIPSSISSISPQSDRSSTRTVDKKPSTLDNKIEFDTEEECTLRDDSRQSRKLSTSDTTKSHSVGDNQKPSSAHRADTNSTTTSKEDNVLSDPEESVHVIEFQNGSFSEYLDKAPPKEADRTSKSISSPSRAELTAMKRNLDQKTESLVAEYQELAHSVKKSPPFTASKERLLTEQYVLRGGARPKPLPLIANTPTMSFLDSYLNCSPPRGKYGDVTLSDTSQSFVVKKFRLDFSEDDDSSHGGSGNPFGQKSSLTEGTSTQQSSHEDEIHKHPADGSLSAQAPQKATNAPFCSADFNFFDEDLESLISDLDLNLSCERTNQSRHMSAEGSVNPDLAQNPSTVPKSAHPERLHRSPHKSQTWDFFNEDASCLVDSSPKFNSPPVGKLVDI